jgi:hypothetical protein
MGANWRYADIPYIYGEGFSRKYDYFKRAVKLGIIDKAGAGWYSFDFPYSIDENDNENTPESIKVQGELNTYNKLKEDNQFFEAVKKQVDAANIAVGVLPEEERGDEEEALGIGEDNE